MPDQVELDHLYPIIREEFRKAKEAKARKEHPDKYADRPYKYSFNEKQDTPATWRAAAAMCLEYGIDPETLISLVFRKAPHAVSPRSLSYANVKAWIHEENLAHRNREEKLHNALDNEIMWDIFTARRMFLGGAVCFDKTFEEEAANYVHDVMPHIRIWTCPTELVIEKHKQEAYEFLKDRPKVVEAGRRMGVKGTEEIMACGNQ
jgi:hypothetical protein